jgi:steroid 5-alpha reductase family enzyme
MPTIIVYIGSISLYPTVFIRTEFLGFIDFFAIIITAAAIIIETLADQQLFKHLRNRTDPQKILTRGLWNYSRYPNYFGEILFWWGLYIFRLSADISYYWGIIGPISITILFNVISIP